jgi:hypothetical protein
MGKGPVRQSFGTRGHIFETRSTRRKRRGSRMTEDQHTQQDPTQQYPQPEYPEQDQRDQHPGLEAEMQPEPDYGYKTYRGMGRLEGKAAIITGGDSGIGRAVALAFAREGADVLISYLSEEEPDAQETAQVVEEAGKRVVKTPGDIAEEAQCRRVVEEDIEPFGRIGVLVKTLPTRCIVKGYKASARGSWSTHTAQSLLDVLPVQGSSAAHEGGLEHCQHAPHRGLPAPALPPRRRPPW